MNSTHSFIRKIISKGVLLTPHEAIHLKYLSRKGILQRLIKQEMQTNTYQAVNESVSVISPPVVRFMCQCAQLKDPKAYAEINNAYEQLFNLDDHLGTLGYKGLTLLTQLTSMRNEYFVRLMLDEQPVPSKEKIDEALGDFVHLPIMNFSSFSFVHQKDAQFIEVVRTLREIFSDFMKCVDNILTLNFYLDELVDLNDLDCLRYLQMWLSDGKGTENYIKPYFNAMRLFCNESHVMEILDDNHTKYIKFLGDQINLSASFEDSSLQYIKDVIKKTTSLSNEV